MAALMAEAGCSPSRSLSRSRSPDRGRTEEGDAASDASGALGGVPPVQGRAPRGVRGGTFQYLQQMRDAGVPEGYKTIADLAERPMEKLLAIFGEDSPPGASPRRRRFESMLQYGMMLHTDFTGKGSVEQVMRMLGVAAED